MPDRTENLQQILSGASCPENLRLRDVSQVMISEGTEQNVTGQQCENVSGIDALSKTFPANGRQVSLPVGGVPGIQVVLLPQQVFSKDSDRQTISRENAACTATTVACAPSSYLLPIPNCICSCPSTSICAGYT